jgi:hypothetical protein
LYEQSLIKKEKLKETQHNDSNNPNPNSNSNINSNDTADEIIKSLFNANVNPDPAVDLA